MKVIGELAIYGNVEKLRHAEKAFAAIPLKSDCENSYIFLAAPKKRKAIVSFVWSVCPVRLSVPLDRRNIKDMEILIS